MVRGIQRAFDYLKDSLTAVPLLVYPDSNKPYVLYTDASDTCIGACLTQECEGDEKPIYYLSHKLSRSQCKWPVVKKECFAIHFAPLKVDYYLHYGFETHLRDIFRVLPISFQMKNNDDMRL